MNTMSNVMREDYENEKVFRKAMKSDKTFFSELEESLVAYNKVKRTAEKKLNEGVQRNFLTQEEIKKRFPDMKLTESGSFHVVENCGDITHTKID